jgi:hypothetical protein
MRTHHRGFYLALAAGAALGILVSTMTGLWLDQHRAIGKEGILVFLGAAVVLILAIEVMAGVIGDWVDFRLYRRQVAHYSPLGQHRPADRLI